MILLFLFVFPLDLLGGFQRAFVWTDRELGVEGVAVGRIRCNFGQKGRMEEWWVSG